jgi:broad specificity phosphatase PhoE
VKLILVRHGETDYNRGGLALGRKDVPLNDLGLRQAAALEFALAGERIAAVYSSPLGRALETARRIATPHDLAVAVEERLIEMDIGDLEGHTFAEIGKRHPDLYQNWGGPNGPTYVMPGSEETLARVQVRALAALSDIIERHREDEGVVVVSHNFVILASLAGLLRIELAEFRRLRHAVAAISSVDVNGERAQVITLNDTCHLRGLE